MAQQNFSRKQRNSYGAYVILTEFTLRHRQNGNGFMETRHKYTCVLCGWLIDAHIMVLLLLSADMKESLDDDASDVVDADNDDDDDDEGFCVIPIPDCFNMDLPPSRTATTSLIVRKSATSSAQGVLVLSVLHLPVYYLLTS